MTNQAREIILRLWATLGTDKDEKITTYVFHPLSQSISVSIIFDLPDKTIFLWLHFINLIIGNHNNVICQEISHSFL